jgi:hypothetical protein
MAHSQNLSEPLQKYIKILIHNYEFRKGINTSIPEAWVTINYNLLTPKTNLVDLFREDNDVVVRQISAEFNVYLKFTHGKITIRNRRHSNIHDLEGALNAVMERIKFDMDYLHRKNKLKPTSNKPTSTLPVKQPTPESEPKTTAKPLSAIPPSLLPNLPSFTTPPPASSIVSNEAFPGLVVIIEKPTPEIVAKLYSMNVKYTLMPEFLIKQMLNMQVSLPPPNMPPPQVPSGAEEGEIV